MGIFLFQNRISVWWNLNDSTLSLLRNIYTDNFQTEGKVLSSRCKKAKNVVNECQQNTRQTRPDRIILK